MFGKVIMKVKFPQYLSLGRVKQKVKVILQRMAILNSDSNDYSVHNLV